MDKGGLEFAFTARVESFEFDLLGEVDIICRDAFEDGFFCAPVDGELLVSALVVKVFDLVFGESALLDCREIPVEGFDIDSDIFFIVENDGDILFCMRNTDICHHIFEIRLAVVMVAEIDLIVKELAQKSADRKALLALRFVADK